MFHNRQFQFVPWVSLPLQDNTTFPAPNFAVPTPLRLDNSTLQSLDATYDTLDQDLTRRLQKVRQEIITIHQVSHPGLFIACLPLSCFYHLQLYCFGRVLSHFQKALFWSCPANFPCSPCGSHSPHLSVDLNLLSPSGTTKKNKHYIHIYRYPTNYIYLVL